MILEGKLALVTGSSRGLGRASAIALANQGCVIAVNYLKNKNEASQVVELIRQNGGKAESFQADVSKEMDVKSLSSNIKKRLGDVDILVNNGASIPRPGNWDLLGGKDLEYTIAVNLTSVIHCIREFAPAMIKKNEGRIINIASTYAIPGAAAVLAYTAAKAGVISVTRSMARELGKYNITVNAIAPGNFDTALAVEAGEGFAEWAASTTPLGRLGKPEEIGEAVVALVKSNFITGDVLVVDGGQLLNI